jgi:protein-S-isoprenylcysteine O-methyltransferase Ste14
MKLQLVFFSILLGLYLLHDLGFSFVFKRRFHKQEDFLGKNAPDAMQRFFGRAVYLVLFYYLLVLAYLIFNFNFWGFISGISVLNKTLVQVIGFAFGVIFIALMSLARLNLGSSWRVGLDLKTEDPLVTDGFYRFTRNPYFTFLLGFQFSAILVVPTAVTIFAFIQSFLLLSLQVRQEEPFLHDKYGDKYDEYRANTGRFLPLITKRKMAISTQTDNIY